ncbi:hypothetical protein KKF84_04340, partial [Myxococcota bacterium]|nr:hypothetical protein [Myxococcota bacterium]
MRITCLIFALLLISCARTPGTSISMMESMPSGRWSMEKRTSKGGAQIIDRQLWDIVKKGNVFKVRMDFYRMAHSMSGFPCNGSPSYNLHMRFDFSRAHLVNGDLVLGTPTVKHTPNACDERLPELKGATLRSHRGGRLLYVQSKRAEVLHPFSLTGVWSYKRVTPNKGNIDSKIEIEEWNLVQHRDRSVSGFYDRIVVRKS